MITCEHVKREMYIRHPSGDVPFEGLKVRTGCSEKTTLET